MVLKRRHESEKPVQARMAAEEAMKDALQTKWRDENERLERYVNMARGFRGSDPSEIRGLNFAVHPGELIFGGFRAELIEMRNSIAHGERRSNAGETPIAKDVRYRIVVTRGPYTAAADAPTVIESGAVTITTRRLVFQGPTQAREWQFANLVRHVHHDRWPWTCIQVSDRNMASGVATTPEQAAEFRFAFELALAHHDGTVDALTTEFEQELAEHRATGPNMPLL